MRQQSVQGNRGGSDWRENGAIRDRRDAAGAWLAKVCENFPVPAYQHFVTNVEIDIDGDTATTRQLQLIPISLKSPGGGRQMAFSGIWFEDRLVRDGGDWKIAKPVERLAWRHNFPDRYETPDGVSAWLRLWRASDCGAHTCRLGHPSGWLS